MSNLMPSQPKHCLEQRKVMSGPFKLDNRYETTRQKILDEAYRIVIHQGIDQLSMRSIATAVKSSPANLYEYFTSKDEIVYELHTKLLTDLAIHLQAVDAQLSPDDYLEQLGVAYLNFALQHSALFKLHGHYKIEAGFAVKPYASKNDMHSLNGDGEATHPLYNVLQHAIQRQFSKEAAVSESSRPSIHDRTIAFWSLVHGYATLMWLAVRPEYSIAAWQRLFRQFFLTTP